MDDFESLSDEEGEDEIVFESEVDNDSDFVSLEEADDD